MQLKESTGGCLCGAVRYRVTGQLRDALICHCVMCQRQHTYAGAYTACAADELEITAADALRWFQSSDIARRGFCATCGAGLFWAPAHGGHISIAAGSLDDTAALRLAGHIYAAARFPLAEIPDGAPRWDGDGPLND